MQIDGVIIFESNSGLPLYSMVDKSIDSVLFSGFMVAIRNFFSQLSLGGISSFTTEDKIIFLASDEKIITAIVTEALDYKKGYAIAFEISKRFNETYDVQDASIVSMESGYFDDFTKVVKKIIAMDESILDTVPTTTIYLYTINKQGDLINLAEGQKNDISKNPIIIIVNTITKHIYVLENGENIPNKLLFLAGNAATNLNNQNWKNEFRVLDISDPINCQRLLDQVNTLMDELNQ